jgi:homoserine dehydrogenase
VRRISIGVLGAGNVGGGVVRILEANRESIERRLGASLHVRRVLVRDPARPRELELPQGRFTGNAMEVIDDPDVQIVVELIGGLEPARTWVLAALRAGKHVVTANKALLGRHGKEIFDEAAAHGVSVFFEGSVAGGVPILRVLREGLASDRISSIIGIVNGTSNFVLDAMARDRIELFEAVARAQSRGYAEADPSLDVGGQDAAQKLALLALVGFGVRVDPAAIPTEGIERVRPFEHQMARELGYVVKSVAIARNDGDRPMLAVYPALVPDHSVLADVREAYNAVLVQSDALGRSLYYGQGAGSMPTGMAVVSDIIEVGRGLQSESGGGPPPQAFSSIHDAVPRPLDDERTENYLCAHVPNVPGVLGRVASCLGRHGVSIKRMNQDTPGPAEPIDMVILTEAVEDHRIRSALAELDGYPDALSPTHRLRILPPELVA